MKKIIISLIISLSLCSCYDDKGNYKYGDTNEINVKLDNAYLTDSYDTTIEIEPIITQSLRTDDSNLEYIWYFVNSNDDTYDTLSHDKKISIVIDKTAEGENFSFSRAYRLAVTDKETGLVYNTDTKVNVLKPYFNCWTILHKKDGVTKLATVEYKEGQTFFNDDTYKSETSSDLKGEPLFLSCLEHFQSLYYKFDEYNNAIRNGYAIITTDQTESGIYCQWEDFVQKDNMQSMVFKGHAADFDINKVSFFGGSMGHSICCLSNGHLFQSLSAGKFYKAPIDSEQIKGNTYFSKISIDGYCALLYDKIGKRFVWYRNSEYANTYDPKIFEPSVENIPSVRAIIDHPKNAFNPNEITDDEILYVGQGYASDNKGVNYAIGYNTGSLTIYEFNNNDPMLGKPIWPETEIRPSCVSKKTGIALPEGFKKDCHIETSRAYSNIFFYTSENIIYRFDFTTKAATPIYTHPGAVGITNMKFVKRQYTYLDNDVTVGDNYTNWQKMGVVFEMADGTSEFVALHIDNSGKIDKKNKDGYLDDYYFTHKNKYEPIQIYKGLGKVADIEFL